MKINNFDAAFHNTIGHEGGYVNHPNDPGGETKYGISKRSYPHLNIANLTLKDAKEIYYKDFWQKLNLELLPKRMAMKVFDTSVNMGLIWGPKLLQRAINRLYGKKMLVVDGIIGPQTIGIFKCLTDKSIEELLLSHYPYVQWKRYKWLMTRNPKLLSFYNGWKKRAFSVI